MKITINDNLVNQLVSNFVNNLSLISTDYTGETTFSFGETTRLGDLLKNSFQKHILAEDTFLGDYENEEELISSFTKIVSYLTNNLYPKLLFYRNTVGLASSAPIPKTTATDKTVNSSQNAMAEDSPLTATLSEPIQTPKIKSNSSGQGHETETYSSPDEYSKAIEWIEKNKKYLIVEIHNEFVFLVAEYNYLY